MCLLVGQRHVALSLRQSVQSAQIQIVCSIQGSSVQFSSSHDPGAHTIT